MDLKQELQKSNERLEKYRRKLAAAELRKDPAVVAQFQREIAAITKTIAGLQGRRQRQLRDKGEGIKALPFSRALSKSEQADMGKLKRSVRGLVVVHPMTALGRDIGIEVVTGFAPAEF